jgi:hypothetical protein
VDEESVSLAPVPAGREADENEYEEVFEILPDIEVEDVFPATEKQLTWDSLYTCTLKSGLIYQVQTATEGDKFYLIAVAQSPLEGRQVYLEQDESEEELKKKETLLLANDKSEAFNETHQGWVYEVSDYDAEVLRRSMEELLVELEQEDEDDQE